MSAIPYHLLYVVLRFIPFYPLFSAYHRPIISKKEVVPVRKFVAVVLLFLTVFSSALAEPWRVFDNAGIFSESEIEELENEIKNRPI